MRLVSFIAVISVTALILFPLESACGPAGKEKVVVAERGASRNNGKPKGEGGYRRVLLAVWYKDNRNIDFRDCRFNPCHAYIEALHALLACCVYVHRWPHLSTIHRSISLKKEPESLLAKMLCRHLQ